jgi:hypothetical protein
MLRRPVHTRHGTSGDVDRCYCYDNRAWFKGSKRSTQIVAEETHRSKGGADRAASRRRRRSSVEDRDPALAAIDPPSVRSVA